MFHNGIEFLPSYLPAIYVSYTKEPKIRQDLYWSLLARAWVVRLAKCGLFVVVLVAGTQFYCVPSWCSSYLSAAAMFPITLSVAALITWVGFRLVDWMVLEERGRTVEWWEMIVEFLYDIRERFELPIGPTRAGDLS